MNKWKDVSTFSQSDKERIPSVFKKKIGILTLTVHRHVHHAPDRWLLTCAPLFTRRELASKKVVEAMGQATALVQVELENALAEILNT